MKLSSTPEKATYPCAKSIYRVISEDNQYFDLIALDEEQFNTEENIEIGNLKDKSISTVKVSSIRLLNEIIGLSPVNIKESRAYVERSRGELPEKIFELQNPESYKTYMTKGYLEAFSKAFEKASQGSNTNKVDELVQKSDPSSPLKVKVGA